MGDLVFEAHCPGCGHEFRCAIPGPGGAEAAGDGPALVHAIPEADPDTPAAVALRAAAVCLLGLGVAAAWVLRGTPGW